MTELNPTTAMIPWNVNGLNAPIKKRKSLEGIKIQDPTILWLQEIYLKKTQQVKSERLYHANTSQNKAAVAVYINIRQCRFQSKEYHHG